MLGSLLDFLFAPWLRQGLRQAVTFVAGLYHRLLLPLLWSLGRLLGGALPSRQQQQQPSAGPFPLTREQHLHRARAYLESLDRDAILRLIDRHCGGSGPATYVDHGSNVNGAEVWLVGEIMTGSPGARQNCIVRIPLDPATYSSWETVQSEVCTIEYIRNHTQIPVQELHGYGRARLLQNSYRKQCYMIFGLVEGYRLSYSLLDHCSTQARKRLFEDLIRVMIQLRRLHFDAGGSLQPDRVRGLSEPVVSDPLTRNINTLKTHGFRFTPQRAESVRDYIATQYDVLQAIHDIPVPGRGADYIAIQTYGLDTMRERIGAPTSRPLPERFTLSLDHLEPYDITVDDQLNLVAINTWKWASTLPAAFATPPRWILDNDAYRIDFDTVVANMKRRNGRGKLKLNLPKNDWLSRGANDILAHTAHVFQSPKAIVDVYGRDIHPQLSDETEEVCEERWFAAEIDRSPELFDWADTCTIYHEQLEKKGLLSWDQDAAAKERMYFDHAKEAKRREAAHDSSRHVV